MTSIDKQKIACPHCGKKSVWSTDNTFRPFCSERCKLIDLGSWADEAYRVSGEEGDATKPSEDHEE